MAESLSKETKVTLGLGVAFLFSAIAGTWAVAAILFGVKYELRSLRIEVEAIAGDVEKAASDRWTRTDQRNWEILLGAYNPELRLPGVRAPEVDDE